MRFVLVHGASVGGWCFDWLVPELVSRGHEVIAPDLPGHGDRMNEAATFDGYVKTVVDLIQPDDVLLGYSMGGWVVTPAANERLGNVKHIIYLAAAVHVEGLSMMDSMKAATAASTGNSDQPAETSSYLDHVEFSESGSGFATPSKEETREFVFPDVPEDIADLIYSRFTEQSLVPQMEPIHTPEFRKSNIPRSYIGYVEDKCVPVPVGEYFADLLGVEPKWLPGSHMGGLVCHAKETADAILDAVLGAEAAVT